jgi:hypothetical protein
VDLIQIAIQQIIYLSLSLIFIISSYLIGKTLLGKKIQSSNDMNFVLFLIFGFFVNYLFNLSFSLVGAPSSLVYILPTTLIIAKTIIFNRNDLKGINNRLKLEVKKVKHWKIKYKIIYSIQSIYVLSYSITYFRGADLSIYHLVVPERILSNLRLSANIDSFSAGIPFAWHITNIPTFLVGGETSYLAMNFWIFQILMLLLVPLSLKLIKVKNSSKIEPLAIILVGAYLIFTLNGSITNTDIVSIFFEISCILIAFRLYKDSNVGVHFWIIFGLITGYCFSIKFTTIFTLVFIYGLIILEKNIRLIYKLTFLLSSLLVSSFWVVYNKISYGYFIAISFNSQSNSENSYIINESIKEFLSIYSKWYILNSTNLIAGSLIVIPICVAITLGGLFTIRYSKSQKNLLIFGTLHYLALVVLIPRYDIVFHDRYHILTYITLIMFSLITIDKFHINYSRFSNFCVSVLISSIIFGSLWQNTIRFPTEDSYEIKTKNIFEQIFINFSSMKSNYAKINLEREKNNFPIGSKVATNTIAPYALHTDYLQLLPFVTQSINLGITATEIACELIKNETNYLAIYPSSSTIPGTEDIIEKHLVEVRKISKVYGVEPINNVTLGEKGEALTGVFYLNSSKIKCKES